MRIKKTIEKLIEKYNTMKNEINYDYLDDVEYAALSAKEDMVDEILEDLRTVHSEDIKFLELNQYIGKVGVL